MKKINEFLDTKKELTLEERIKQIKLNNPGKFDHLPDPVRGSAFRNWSDEDFQEILDLLKKKFPNS